jgi:superfamily II DNA/RNA helicase
MFKHINYKIKFRFTLQRYFSSIIKEQNILSFRQFNLIPEIYSVLDKLNYFAPTSIQSVALTKIMEGKNIFLASAPGTGKTLTYLLPLLHFLKTEEVAAKQRLTIPKRPRALILVPSRELAIQVEEVCKLFVYDVPLVVESFFVGKKYVNERITSEKGIDILISTPERFKNHWSKGSVYVTHLSYVIFDDFDTALDAGNVKLVEELLPRFFGKTEEEGKSNIKQSLFVSTTLTIVSFN